jgi:hypothetical protein
MLLAIAPAPVGLASDATTAPSGPAEIRWLTSLDAAYLQAQRTQQPILLFIESHDDPASAMAFAKLQASIAADANRWVPARLDVAESHDALPDLGVSVLPAIRLLSTNGRLTASLDEPNAVESMARWLDANRPAAETPPADSPTRQDLLAQLTSSDAAAREISIRRLMPDRAAASDVIEILFNGKMSARLAALDLLEQWGAPLGSIDPWDRATMTQERHQSLLNWAKAAAAAPATAPTTGPGASASDLNFELDELLSAPTALEARAVRERLVRFGEAALPAVYQRLAGASSAAAIARLTALRPRRLSPHYPPSLRAFIPSPPRVRRIPMRCISPSASSVT